MDFGYSDRPADAHYLPQLPTPPPAGKVHQRALLHTPHVPVDMAVLRLALWPTWDPCTNYRIFLLATASSARGGGRGVDNVTIKRGWSSTVTEQLLSVAAA